ncbi:MAG: TIGR03618 family F420-dependent PPOX class oxidoreductase [Gammaproteobacteria bacterium]|nr:TIGR03618 family F420-dependent PPOX class oxidoreductase [Gammaproteobacteria bacterium]
MEYSTVTYGPPVHGNKPLTPEELAAFLAETRHAIIGTTNPDGSPRVTPVGFLWDGTSFYAMADGQRYWVRRNLRRDPRMTLVVEQGDDYRAVVASGRAEILDRDIGDLTRRILVKYFGAEAGAAYFDQFQREPNENRVVVALKPDRMQTWQRDDGEDAAWSAPEWTSP